MSKPFTCGRQDLSGPFKHLVAYERDDGTCSYCGSITSERFFAAVEAGAKLGPTDKSYKVYIDLPHPKAGGMEIVQSANSPQTGEGWIEATPEVCEQYGWKPWGQDTCWVKPSVAPAMRTGKFYFQHFDEADQARFIELYNAKKLNIGMPGYFYATPYFCAPATA